MCQLCPVITCVTFCLFICVTRKRVRAARAPARLTPARGTTARQLVKCTSQLDIANKLVNLLLASYYQLIFTVTAAFLFIKTQEYLRILKNTLHSEKHFKLQSHTGKCSVVGIFFSSHYQLLVNYYSNECSCMLYSTV